MIRRCSDADFREIEAVINEAAQAYRGVEFWGWEESGALVGVMGLQRVRDVTLIRHAYVRTADQGRGIGGALLRFLTERATGPFVGGTWGGGVWGMGLLG